MGECTVKYFIRQTNETGFIASLGLPVIQTTLTLVFLSVLLRVVFLVLLHLQQIHTKTTSINTTIIPHRISAISIECLYLTCNEAYWLWITLHETWPLFCVKLLSKVTNSCSDTWRRWSQLLIISSVSFSAVTFIFSVNETRLHDIYSLTLDRYNWSWVSITWLVQTYFQLEQSVTFISGVYSAQ